MYNILIAEDDLDIIEVLTMYLENAGYVVNNVNDGESAVEYVKNNKVDLCIFDIMMPKLNGYEVTKRIRTFTNVPILILSAKDKDSDKIIGLNIGADDYLTKPFNPLEVVARVNSLLRRSYNFSRNLSNNMLVVGELKLDTEKFCLYKNDENIPITATEYKILLLLMKTPGKIYTKVQIYETINGMYFETDDNTMMVHISKLRDKIEDDTKNPRYIKTVRGLGYKIEG